MFVTDSLVYLELHKTGSSHVRGLLADLLGGAGDKHARLPANFEADGRLVVGSVRNPWETYASLWSYGASGRGSLHNRLTSRRYRLAHGLQQARRAEPGWLRDTLAAARKMSPAHWRVTYADDSPATFRRWLTRLLDPTNAVDVGESYAAHAADVGLLTHRYLHLYCDSEDAYAAADLRGLASQQRFLRDHGVLDAVIRNECLEEDLLDVLDRAGVTLTTQQRIAVQTAGRSNTSRRRWALHELYDRDTTDLVARRDALLVQSHDYSPPAHPA